MADELVLDVDHRERGSAVPGALQAAGARLEFVSLKAGDYRVGRVLAIERKSAWDFWKSIFDGRLFRQAIRLARSSPRPLILVEGQGPNFSHPAARGALVTVAAVFGVPVLFSRDPRDSALWILTAARQYAARRENAIARPGWRPRGKRARQIFVLQGLPGIGPVRGARLLDRFGTVRAVLSADEQSLSEVHGIGRKTAQRIVWLAT